MATFSIVGGADATQEIFIGDRLQFGNNSQKYPGQVFLVRKVTTTTITLNSTVLLPGSTLTIKNSPIYRVMGGRGFAYNSRIGCTADTASVLCPPGRVPSSGSMQSKLQNMPSALTQGVQVARDGPDSTGGYLWRVTFLDQAASPSTNFNMFATSLAVHTASGAANITVTKQMDGSVNPACTGVLQIPTAQTLTIGQYYWARVFAVNEVGYSLPQISASSQKPMVVPGRPTAVTLTVFSATELRITFNPPASDGGDTITSYRIEFATRSDFSNAQVSPTCIFSILLFTPSSSYLC